MQKSLLLVIIISMFGSSFIVADSFTLGTPFIVNYKRSDYNAGNQTWDIQQGSNGMMYFANNDGLLEFDGNYWNIYSLPNRSILRSIENGTDGIIYAGGYNELGYFEIGEMGGAKYNSLLDRIPEEHRDFDDVWKIYSHPDGIIFQTYRKLFIYSDEEFNIIEAPSLFQSSFLVHGDYYVDDMEMGLLRYAMGNLFELNGVSFLIGKEIRGIVSVGDKLLISTAVNGAFMYDGNLLIPIDSKSNTFLKQNHIYTIITYGDQLIFGTIHDGILITDIQGNLIQHMCKEDGLQNNTILCIGTDFLGNLWLGTDHGIDYVELNLPLSSISYNYNVSTGYAAYIKNNRIYLGTNQGLYTSKIDDTGRIYEKKMFQIEETSGQVWTIQDIDGSLFCGHNNGVFIINDTNAKKISDIPGGWLFRQIPQFPNLIIGGTYNGLTLYSKENGEWKFEKKLDGFSQSSRKMEFDNDGSLWVTHGYKGIYHINFNSNYDSIVQVDFYNSQDIDIPDFVTGITKIDGKIIFITGEVLLQYSAVDNRFFENSIFGKVFVGMDIRAIVPDLQGNLWYFDDDNTGVFRLGEDDNYTEISRPFSKLKGKLVASFELVYPYNDEFVLFGTETGFVVYNPKSQKKYSYEFNTYMKSLKIFDPDSVFSYADMINDKLQLNFDNNSIEFEFSANDFENAGTILYSTFLEGNDKQWSRWNHRSTRNYTNLFEGDYTFRVKAKNIYGTISDEQSVSFKVEPPIIRSLAAYTIYALLLLLFIMFIGFAIRRRYKRAKQRSEKEQKELFRKREAELNSERLESEKEVIRMRNDKLREGIKQKDKELANSTMQMLQKNEMLITLRDELKKLAGFIESDTHKHDVIRLVRGINKEIDNEKQWQVFETHFESVHEEFLKRVKVKYANLTPRELKLCAYLRMNISSKEISVLMNISTRGVEISRYRLRKKLELSRETNLTEFILSF